MGYWKAKVLPIIKKVFDKSGPKKAAAAETCKTFDDSKEEINREFEEKKEELKPKVLEIYEASSAETKAVVKERTEAGVKKQSAGVNKFLEELAKIEFPGSKIVSEASSKYGPVLVCGPIFFLFEKVSSFLPVEEPAVPRDVEMEPEAPAPAVPAEQSSTQEKEVVSEGEKKEEVKEKEAVIVPETAEAAPSSTEEASAGAPPPEVPEMVVKAEGEAPKS